LVFRKARVGRRNQEVASARRRPTTIARKSLLVSVLRWRSTEEGQTRRRLRKRASCANTRAERRAVLFTPKHIYSCRLESVRQVPRSVSDAGCFDRSAYIPGDASSATKCAFTMRAGRGSAPPRLNRWRARTSGG
jgi:hypothetical protein